jgi:hypothetical protein
MHSDVVRWCPSCRRLTRNVVTAPPVYDARLSDAAPDDTPRVTRLKRYCENCGEVWESVEAPRVLFDDLLEVETRLEDYRRQLAMVRLLLARDRHQAAPAPHRQTIPLRRAA